MKMNWNIATLALSVVLFLGSGLIELNAMNLTSTVSKQAEDIKTLTATVASLTEDVKLDHELIMRSMFPKTMGRP